MGAEVHAPIVGSEPIPAPPVVPTDASRRVPTALFERATAAVGLALAVLVGTGGITPWWLVRVVLVLAVTLVLIVAQPRPGGRRHGLVPIAVGVLAVAVAAGFGPHLVRGGPLAVRLATVVLGLAGLVLLVAGTVVEVRRLRWSGRVVAVLAVIVATGLVALVVAPAVAATNVPRVAVGATPDTVGLEHRDVRLWTDDGVTLAGWYVPSRNRAAVVLLHGSGSTRSDVLPQAAALADAGYGVLMVDARGHGDSGGRAMDFGWDGDHDVAAATAFLATRSDVDRDRIGAVGISMGGEEAIGASGSNSLLRAVVAEGATARNAADESWLSDEYGLRGWFQERLEVVQDWVTDPLTSASNPPSMRSAIGASGPTRYLLITAGRVDDERRAADHLASADPDRVEIWTVDGADHAGGLDAAPGDWVDRVVGFLDDVLHVDGP